MVLFQKLLNFDLQCKHYCTMKKLKYTIVNYRIVTGKAQP